MGCSIRAHLHAKSYRRRVLFNPQNCFLITFGGMWKETGAVKANVPCSRPVACKYESEESISGLFLESVLGIFMCIACPDRSQALTKNSSDSMLVL